MKIENKRLARYFKKKDGQYFTSHLVNKLNGQVLLNQSEKEFTVVFSDGQQLSSSECQVHVVEATENHLLLQFNHSLLQILVDYSTREDVLSKQVSIYKSEKKINFIDVELLEFEDTKDIFYPKKQENIKEMANFSGYYVELGQPIYAKSLFLGMEFPMGENRIQDKAYFSRYYVGYKIEHVKTIWSTVIGAAQGADKSGIQQAFFEYIEKIAVPSSFRKQYNSWYDHMTGIDEDIILKSFSEIYHGFEDYGVHLDAYVVDDGWCDYQSVWEFNQKFPNKLSKVSALVQKLNSSLGLWIGPRGGYGGTQIVMSDWLEQNAHLGSKNKLSNDVNVGDFKYLQLMKEKMLDYQKEFNISYWKIDGWLLKPDVPDETGEFAMHTMTPVYEFLIDLLKDLRKERGERDCWLNLTSYVNPSPWFLQWVNSLWIQVSQDVSFTENAGSDTQRMITYRDTQYREFLEKRDIQLPLWSLYNHDPIYARTAHRGYLEQPISSTVEEFEDYLMFIATRGNAFWEFHYSYDMFDEERWKANARAVKWIEQNYDILKQSRIIGGQPEKFEIYGYHCKHPTKQQEIMALRNPSYQEQEIHIAHLPSAFEIVKGKETYIKENGRLVLPPFAMLILASK